MALSESHPSPGMKTSPVKQSEYEGSPRHCQDGGPGPHGSGTPSEWGKSGFSVETNKAYKSSSVNNPHDVNLGSGNHS